MATTFVDTDHPRSAAGKFAAKAHAEAEVSLADGTSAHLGGRLGDSDGSDGLYRPGRTMPEVQSHSSLSDFSFCPTRWALARIDGAAVPDDVDESLRWAGIVAHRSAELAAQGADPDKAFDESMAEHPTGGEWYSQFRANGGSPTDLDDPATCPPDAPDDVVAARRAVVSFSNWERTDPDRDSLIVSEVRIDATVAGVDLTGVIDAVEVDPDGAVVVTDYKGLALDTPLPTPDGWTTMAEVQVGDLLIGSDGRPTKVLVKSGVHNRPCYEMTFSDGSTVTCDNVHLWNVTDLSSVGRVQKTYDTDALFELYTRLAIAGRTRSLVIQNARALDLPDAALPVDPYLLGVWLGDGLSKAGNVTIGDEDVEDMVQLIAERWPNVHTTVTDTRSQRPVHTASLLAPDPGRCPCGHEPNFNTNGPWRRCRTCEAIQRGTGVELDDLFERTATRAEGHCIYGHKKANGRGECSTCRQARSSVGGARFREMGKVNAPFSSGLREIGVLNNKHIPTRYLRGSSSQRIELLRGLCDTDGYWNPTRGRVEFRTSVRHLAEQVASLIDTMGITAGVSTDTDSKTGYVSYKVSFRPLDFVPFHLPRKAGRVETWLTQRGEGGGTDLLARRRAIVGIAKTPSVPTQCVAVDAPDSLYLCGERMVPTHNTGKPPAKTTFDGDDDLAKATDGGSDAPVMYPAKTTRQLVLYAEMAAATGRRIDRVRLLYPASRGVVEVDLDGAYGDHLRAEARQFVATETDRLAEAHETGVFPARPSPRKCASCSQAQNCPAAA